MSDRLQCAVRQHGVNIRVVLACGELVCCLGRTAGDKNTL
jgi:hypothetical protein